MRHWSPWDDQLLRILRGEFRHDAPRLSFELGTEGGVATFHSGTEIGLWVAASRLSYRYMPADGEPVMEEPCEVMDIVKVSRAVFFEFIEPENTD